MWQTCPICKGTGTEVGKNPYNEENKNSCPICKGGLIIDESGRPPKYYLKQLQIERAIKAAEAVMDFCKNYKITKTE